MGEERYEFEGMAHRDAVDHVLDDWFEGRAPPLADSLLTELETHLRKTMTPWGAVRDTETPDLPLGRLTRGDGWGLDYIVKRGGVGPFGVGIESRIASRYRVDGDWFESDAVDAIP